VEFSPDGQSLAAASPLAITIWDSTTGKERFTIRTAELHDLAFHPDGVWIAAACDREVKLWNATSGESIITLRGHTGPVGDIAFSPDGDCLAAGSYGTHEPSVRLWHLPTGKETLVLPTRKPVNSIVFSVHPAEPCASHRAE
jgi:WD40 repeat protein